MWVVLLAAVVISTDHHVAAQPATPEWPPSYEVI